MSVNIFFESPLVQQDLMRPKSAHFYIEDLKKISQDFIEYIKLIRSEHDKTIDNFLPEIYRHIILISVQSFYWESDDFLN